MVFESLNNTEFIGYTLLLLLVGLSMLNAVITFPIIFNYFIVPKVEEKLGQKLGYYRIQYRVMAYGKFFARYSEIAFYIFVKYLIHLCGKDPNNRNVCPKTFVLQRVNYPFEMFSKREIIWSFLAVLNAIVFFGGGGLLMFLTA